MTKTNLPTFDKTRSSLSFSDENLLRLLGGRDVRLRPSNRARSIRVRVSDPSKLRLAKIGARFWVREGYTAHCGRDGCPGGRYALDAEWFYGPKGVHHRQLGLVHVRPNEAPKWSSRLTVEVTKRSPGGMVTFKTVTPDNDMDHAIKMAIGEIICTIDKGETWGGAMSQIKDWSLEQKLNYLQQVQNDPHEMDLEEFLDFNPFTGRSWKSGVAVRREKVSR